MFTPSLQSLIASNQLIQKWSPQKLAGFLFANSPPGRFEFAVMIAIKKYRITLCEHPSAPGISYSIRGDL